MAKLNNYFRDTIEEMRYNVTWPSTTELQKSAGLVLIGSLVFAAAVGWSRIVLGAHFPMDVIAGLALGWACAAGAGSWAQRMAREVPITGRSL